MLFDLVPAKDITGGPWYTDQEFDVEFVETIRAYIIKGLYERGMDSVQGIAERVRTSGIAKVRQTRICAHPALIGASG